MPIPMPTPITDMPKPRFPSGRFPAFCQFRKEIALEMKNLYGFSYSLMHVRSSDKTNTI